MAKNSQSSAEMASIAGRIMQLAGQGGPVLSSRAALRLAMIECVSVDMPCEGEAKQIAECEVDKLIDVIHATLKPYIDDAESMAASVMSQR